MSTETDQYREGIKNILEALKAASDERYRFLKEWEAEAEKWKSEGDMYGFNFHQGMAAGANWCDIIYQRVIRALEAELEKHPAFRVHSSG